MAGKIRWLSLLAVSNVVFHSAVGADPEPGRQVAQEFVSQSNPTEPFGYWLFLPQDYADETRRWPVMLFLHGAGERGDDVERVKVHGPPKLVDQRPEFPFIVVSPQCPKDRWWPGEVRQQVLAELLDHVLKTFRADPQRVYLTGLSMGGFGTWTLAARHPQRFAAAIPICGGGDPATATQLKELPIWVFHGAKDAGVPLALSERMVQAIQHAGGKPKLTVYPEAEHDSWTETYNNPAVYDWLLEQRNLRPAPLPTARPDTALAHIGIVEAQYGEPADKQSARACIYLSGNRSAAMELQSLAKKHREELLAKCQATLAATAFEDLAGAQGQKRIRGEFTTISRSLLERSTVEVWLDLYQVRKGGRLQLD